jgi:hypothetical protein
MMNTMKPPIPPKAAQVVEPEAYEAARQAERDRLMCRELYLIRGCLYLLVAAVIGSTGFPAALLVAAGFAVVWFVMTSWPKP